MALARAYVRRTPVARLGIVYHIVPEPPGRTSYVVGPGLPQNNALAYSELLNRSWPHAQLVLSRNLGQELYLDSILMGGINGEFLPMTLDRSTEIGSPQPTCPVPCST